METLQISFLMGGALAAKYARDGEGHADESWFIDEDVVSKTCRDFNDNLFLDGGEVKLTRLPEEQASVWQLISVSINRQCSSAISVILENSGHLFARMHICLSSFFRRQC